MTSLQWIAVSLTALLGVVRMLRANHRASALLPKLEEQLGALPGESATERQELLAGIRAVRRQGLVDGFAFVALAALGALMFARAA